MPAQSVTSFLVKGVSGVAEDAAELRKGHTYRLTGVQSGKDLTLAGNGTGLVIKTPNATDPSGQQWRVEQIRGEDNRKRYVLTETGADKRLAIRDGALVAEPDEGRRDAAAQWIASSTGDGTWTLVNAATGQLPDVGGQSTNDGASVGVWQPNSGSNQRWKITDVTGG